MVCETGKPRDDAVVRDVVLRARAMNPELEVVGCECAGRNNRKWLREAGADAIVRPVRAYPELAVRALCAPGTEEVLEAQMTSQGARLVRVTLQGPRRVKWGALTAALANGSCGTAVGYTDREGIPHTTPGSDARVEAAGLILLKGILDRKGEEQVQIAVEKSTTG